MIDSVINIVHFLASRKCSGRRTGTPGSAAAREYIIDNMIRAGIHPFAGINGYVHPFGGLPENARGSNIIGFIPGRGELAERFILVDAHYDHLGKHKTGLRYYPGADDNAAAVAAVLHASKIFIETESGTTYARRSILVTCFDAEEPPYFNSEHMGVAHFCKDFPGIIQHIDLAIILDLLAHRMGEGRVPEKFQEIFFVIGAEKSGVGPVLDEMQYAVKNLSPLRIGAHAIPPSGDYVPLQQYQLPYLFMTAGKFNDYHSCYDTAEKLDYPKLEGISNYLAYLLAVLAAADPKVFRYDRLGEDDLATLRTLQLMFDRMDDDEHIPKNQSAVDYIQKRFIRGDVDTVSKLENIRDFLKQGLQKCKTKGSLDHNERSRINYLIEVISRYMH
ncbi:MAG: M28 family peptidase [Candidatus Marinimicrobia bacterium]|nr:M28 family peptidase [Candidatus Neomarinimicrobiota bacterium]